MDFVLFLFIISWSFFVIQENSYAMFVACYVIPRFLFDKSSADFKYYEYRLAEEEEALSQNRESQTSRSGWSESQTSRSGWSLKLNVLSLPWNKFILAFKAVRIHVKH